jgi:uncharacterized membrane protein HdeD (DUF308 family)
MTTALSLNWWAVALRGGAAVLFGLFALLRPGVALGALVFVFGVYALLDGVFAAVAGIRAAEHHERWWPALLEAVLGVGAALAAFLVPAATVVGLLYVVAAWALTSGGLKLAGAIHLGRHVPGAWWLAVAGFVSLVFGVLLLVAPGAGVLALVWWIGVYGLVRGTTLLVLAFRLRRHHHGHRPGPPGGMGEPVPVT